MLGEKMENNFMHSYNKQYKPQPGFNLRMRLNGSHSNITTLKYMNFSPGEIPKSNFYQLKEALYKITNEVRRKE